MARATKQQRNTDSSKFKDAVDASARKNSGVKHDGAGPYVEEPIDGETLRVQAHEMARLVGERAKVRDQKLDALRKYNDKLKGFDDRISELASEVESGVRRVPAQKTLPGTTA